MFQWLISYSPLRGNKEFLCFWMTQLHILGIVLCLRTKVQITFQNIQHRVMVVKKFIVEPSLNASVFICNLILCHFTKKEKLEMGSVQTCTLAKITVYSTEREGLLPTVTKLQAKCHCIQLWHLAWKHLALFAQIRLELTAFPSLFSADTWRSMRKCTTLARMTKNHSPGIPKPLTLSAQSLTRTTTSSTLYQVRPPLSFLLRSFEPCVNFCFIFCIETEKLDTEANILCP